MENENRVLVRIVKNSHEIAELTMPEKVILDLTQKLEDGAVTHIPVRVKVPEGRSEDVFQISEIGRLLKQGWTAPIYRVSVYEVDDPTDLTLYKSVF